MRKIFLIIIMLMSINVSAFAEFPKYLYKFPEAIFIGNVDNVGIYIISGSVIDSKDIKREKPNIKSQYLGNIIYGRFYLAKYDDGKKVGKETALESWFTYKIENGEKRMYIGAFNDIKYLDPYTNDKVKKTLINMGEAVYCMKNGTSFYGIPKIPEYIFRK